LTTIKVNYAQAAGDSSKGIGYAQKLFYIFKYGDARAAERQSAGTSEHFCILATQPARRYERIIM
jgi:hypothetical protein